jgi:hypothetical protein
LVDLRRCAPRSSLTFMQTTWSTTRGSCSSDYRRP